MSKLKFNYNNYNLTPLQLENSHANEKEFELGKTNLNSFPRRLLMMLDNYFDHDVTNVLLNPRLLKSFTPAMNFSEEMILFSATPFTLPGNVQPILGIADDFKIKKSVAADITVLGQLSPWIFQYNVSKVHIMIDPSDIVSRGINEVQKAVRELVVRKYFANIKPVVNLVFRISNISDTLINPMLMLPYETEADSISLVFKDNPNSANEFIIKTKEKTDYYGIIMNTPYEDTKELQYSPWSDLCINFDGKFMDFLNGESISNKAPEPEASFKEVIWNCPDLVKLRSDSKNKRILSLNNIYNHIF